MSTKTKSTSILVYVDRTAISILAEGMNSPSSIKLSSETLKDLELHKADEIANGIKSALDQAKITSGQAYVVFSGSLVFEKEFPDGLPEAKRQEIDDYINIVPFSRVSQRVYRAGKGCRVVVVNRDIYELISEVLAKAGVSAVALAPGSVLGLPALANGLTSEVAKDLLRKSSNIVQNAFNFEEIAAKNAAVEQSSDPRINKKLLSLLVVFGVLIIILIVAFVIMQKQNEQLNKPKGQTINTSPTAAGQAAVINPPPAVSPQVSPVSSSSSSVKIDTVRIQVLNASGISGLAVKVKNQLAAAGFKLVETGNAPTVNGATNVVEFLPSVPGEIQAKISEEVNKNFGPVSSRESKELSFDVVIMLSKNGAAATASGSTKTP